jgi:lysozyme
MTITQEEADQIFAEDLADYEECVNDVIAWDMRQHEYDAFVSICYNIGPGGFADATFVERFNLGDREGCAEAILWWDNPPEIIPRRQGEYVQFLGGYVARIAEL